MRPEMHQFCTSSHQFSELVTPTEPDQYPVPIPRWEPVNRSGAQPETQQDNKNSQYWSWLV